MKSYLVRRSVETSSTRDSNGVVTGTKVVVREFDYCNPGANLVAIFWIGFVIAIGVACLILG
jgi:hypothetical protein